MNNTSQVAFGQFGSSFTNASSDAIKPPTGKVFVAITMIADCTFSASGGLVAEDQDRFINTEDAANDETTADKDYGSGGKVVDSIAFPKGVTIYGRWNEIDVATGSCVAYIG